MKLKKAKPSKNCRDKEFFAVGDVVCVHGRHNSLYVILDLSRDLDADPWDWWYVYTLTSLWTDGESLSDESFHRILTADDFSLASTHIDEKKLELQELIDESEKLKLAFSKSLDLTKQNERLTTCKVT